MIARGTGFVKGNMAAARSRLVAHFKYVEHRLREGNESRDGRRIFSKDQDEVHRQSAVSDVMDHTHNQVAYHKFVLSPGNDEPIQNWREWTRDVMKDLEEHQGKELHWYAVKHDNTDNPHVHVVLAGVGENRISGNLEAVKMYQQDYELLRQSGIDRSDRDWYRQIEEQIKEEDRRDREEMAQSREQPEHRQGGERDR